MKPLLAITAGDPLGIGPEITVKALKDRRVKSACRAVVIGERISLLRAGWKESITPFFCVSPSFDPRRKTPGPDKTAGEISHRAVELAVKLALKKRVDAIVTAPVCKKSWELAKAGFTGHTELLRERASSPRAAMFFVSGELRVALVTEHYPISELPKAVDRGRVTARCLSFNAAIRSLGVKRPRLVLCAMNPHAGDGGTLGGEEIKILAPAVKALRKKGVDIAGPEPSDSAWTGHVNGTWDGLVAIYHDQALAPLKIAAKKPVVHWTHGLPFARTSPAHGTAFDIAGKGTADPSSMIEAILFAVKLCKLKK